MSLEIFRVFFFFFPSFLFFLLFLVFSPLPTTDPLAVFNCLRVSAHQQSPTTPNPPRLLTAPRGGCSGEGKGASLVSRIRFASPPPPPAKRGWGGRGGRGQWKVLFSFYHHRHYYFYFSPQRRFTGRTHDGRRLRKEDAGLCAGPDMSTSLHVLRSGLGSIFPSSFSFSFSSSSTAAAAAAAG